MHSKLRNVKNILTHSFGIPVSLKGTSWEKAQKERVTAVEMMKESYEILRKLGIKIQKSPLLPDIISTV